MSGLRAPLVALLLLIAAAAAIAAAGCQRGLTGARCGCISGWVCCQATNTCLPQAEAAQCPAGGSAGAGSSTGGAPGTAGSAGAAGAAGMAGAAGTAGAAGLGGAAGTAGAAGTVGAAGAGGGSTCSNTDSDPKNCGSCGHSCLGGDCSAGICQPFLLGTIPNPLDYARQTIVTGGKVYVFSQVGRGSAQNAWQLDANVPSTPTEYMTGNGTVGCAMNGQLFWVDYNTGNTVTIDACTFSTCATTKTPIVPVASTEYVVISPGCDRTNNEIIWVTQSMTTSAFTIHRASTTGADARQITSFFFPNDGASWNLMGPGLALSNTDRLFYESTDATGKTVLYYISTKTVNAAGVSIATATDLDTSGLQSTLTNGSIVIFSAFTPSSTNQSFTAPLPNGVLSGTPPPFTGAAIFGGVIDQTTFYGTLSGSATVPADAVVECPLSNCGSPTIIARGQANGNYFADDATAVYWTTSGQISTAGFSVWKAAK